MGRSQQERAEGRGHAPPRGQLGGVSPAVRVGVLAGEALPHPVPAVHRHLLVADTGDAGEGLVREVMRGIGEGGRG